MQKSTTMDAMKMYDTLDGEGTVLEPSTPYVKNARDDELEDEEPVTLPKI